MIRTVNSAFDKFMKDVVNLDKDSVANARNSMKNLLDNIQDFIYKLRRANYQISENNGKRFLIKGEVKEFY